MGSGDHPSGGCHQASAAATQSCSPEPQAAQDAVPQATFCESKTSHWLASTFPGKPSGDYHDLGTATQESGSDNCALARVGQVRFTADGEPRDQWHRIPARHVVWLRGERVPAAEVEPVVQLLWYSTCSAGS